QPPPNGLYSAALKEIGAVLDSQVQRLCRHCYQAQWIMGGIVSLDAGELQPGDWLRQRTSIHWIVLKDHQRIEQFSQARQALDFGQAQMLVSHQLRLVML